MTSTTSTATAHREHFTGNNGNDMESRQCPCSGTEDHYEGERVTRCTVTNDDLLQCALPEGHDEEHQADELEAALAATSNEELLTKYAHLTHKMHAAGSSDTQAHRDARAQRDLLQAECLRRMGGE